MLRELFKRTQVRLAATFAILFTLATGTLFTLLVVNLTGEIEGRVRARVMRTTDALLAVDRKYGFDELVSVVSDEAESLRDTDNIFMLIGDDGKLYAGNVRRVAVFEGWRTIPRSELPSVREVGSSQDRFFARWTPVSKGKLLVGGSDREVRQSRLILLHSVGWGLVITAALSIGGGVYLARRAQRRIDDIGATLTDASFGNLDRRIESRQQGDDLDEVAQKINAMLEHLQGLIQNVNHASTDIAHELKKPMIRLRERLEVASEKATTAEEFKQAVDDALVESDKIVATFEALLNISQLQAGARKQCFVNVDLCDIVRELYELFAPVVEDQGGRLLSRLRPNTSAIVRGDRGLLVQMGANIIENSLRHSPPEVSVTIDLKRSKAGGHLLEISDDGPGIPEAERANVFRRFYRLNAATSEVGHGLGLSLVAAIADLHGATIELQDNAPGLRVVLLFPAAVPLGAYRKSNE